MDIKSIHIQTSRIEFHLPRCTLQGNAAKNGNSENRDDDKISRFKDGKFIFIFQEFEIEYNVVAFKFKIKEKINSLEPTMSPTAHVFFLDYFYIKIA